MTAPWPRLGVYRLPGLVGWMAPSLSLRGAYRHVTWGTENGRTFFTCTCPRGQHADRMGSGFEDPCRHVRLVSKAEAADGIPPRPTPPPNISALVD